MYRISVLKNKNTLIAACFVWGRFLAQAQPTVVPVRTGDTTSNYLSVTVNGKPLHTIKYKDVHYASYQQSGPADLTVTCSEAVNTFSISPLSKNIKGQLKGTKVVVFSLAQPSYVVVTINKKERLFVFAEQAKQASPAGIVSILSYKVDPTGKELNTAPIQAAINETAKSGKTLLFPAGTYRTGKLLIPSHAKIHFGDGAVLKASDDIADFEGEDRQRSRGFITLLNAENVSISGYGVIDGNGRKLRETYGDKARLRLLFLSGCKNVSVQDIIERDPGSWNTQIMHSERVTFNHVKQLNDVALANTDGFDPDASSFVTIENCFGYCGDDNVAIKITQENGASNQTSDVVVKDCVFLTRKSSLKVGTESRGATIKNILFENNDVIQSDRGMALYCSDGAVYENIVYRNNRFEENYPDAKRMGIHFTINKRNPDSKEGRMRNVLIEDCRFYQAFPNASEIIGLNEQHTIDVTIKNVQTGGKELAAPDLKTSFANIKLR